MKQMKKEHSEELSIARAHSEENVEEIRAQIKKEMSQELRDQEKQMRQAFVADRNKEMQLLINKLSEEH